MTITNRLRLAVTVLSAALLSACGGGGGGGGGSTGGATTTYTVSATVAGLNGSLVLQDNGTSNLSVTANGTFNFTTQLASGAAYAVTVLTQPNGQECKVSGGSGKVGTATVSVSISCAALVNYWTWKAGSNLTDGAAVYGNKGTPAPGNTPGARYFASSWTDASHNFWLFGGTYFANSATQDLNDLWKFDPTTGLWTWVSGSNSTNTNGVYNGTPVPGSRYGASTWVDGTGKLWLFGGFGYDSVGATNHMNDLWYFDTGNMTWTFVNGPNTAGGTANFNGPNPLIPGSRYAANSWFDATNNNLYLFGGSGFDTTQTNYVLNDLWYFQLPTGPWHFVTGSQSGGNAGTYTGPTRTPASRYLASAWTDNSGNFWLFGGNIDSTNSTASSNKLLSDLWEFNVAGGAWSLVSGTNAQDAPGVYGTQGTAASGNVPGARFSSSTWTDAAGTLWLFGGVGYDSAGKNSYLNDLWQYSGGKWTWFGGSNAINANGNYGTQGVAAFTNTPGARGGASASFDASGRAWLFGGFGNDSRGGNSYLNDLWVFSR